MKIPGFDFGNSPLEHYGKSYTGASWFAPPPTERRRFKLPRSAQVVLASLRSAQRWRPIWNGRARCCVSAAGLEEVLLGRHLVCGAHCQPLAVREWDDGAKAARLLYEHTPVDALVDSAHGRRLQALGLWDDLRFCLECSVSPGVVIWEPQTGWGALVRER